MLVAALVLGKLFTIMVTTSCRLTCRQVRENECGMLVIVGLSIVTGFVNYLVVWNITILWSVEGVH